MSEDAMRSEQEIFDELTNLCSMPGYIHVIAFVCFRDNLILFSGELKPEDMQHLFSRSRLIRTEVTTLIGLLLKSNIDFERPSSELVKQYLEKTESLLEEMHHAMGRPFWENLDKAKIKDGNFNPFDNAAAMREPIFYGGESAYSFQYRDMSPKKYVNDDQWIIDHKGFSIKTARDVIYSIGKLRDDKLPSMLKRYKTSPKLEWPYLAMHEFTVEEVSKYSGIAENIVEIILVAFTVSENEKNEGFNTLHDFNVANAFPLIKLDSGSYILFNIYSFVEALYEAPFYWMLSDKFYLDTAMTNRGKFTEEFSTERLIQVFGKENVFPNVNLIESKSTKVSEIDVLVIFGGRAIVLQAKSKRLTLESRRGNDKQLKDDFKKSIQDSCNQGYLCSRILGEGKCKLLDVNSNEILIPVALKEIYVLCVISDHYPALSFQARQFLKFTTTDLSPSPFVLDVFTLDAMTEMLNSPLLALSYIDRRTKYSDKLLASHELTILSYHLKQNLWLSSEFDMFMLEDDISTDLDLAMAVRRDNIPGKSTPDGILTRFLNSSLGSFVKQIETNPNPATISFGFMLLTIGEDTVVNVSKGIDQLANRSRVDKKNHDLTVGLGRGDTGFTIYFSYDPPHVVGPIIENHCRLRKYSQQAESWFGVCVNPDQLSLVFGVNLNFKWEHSAEMDDLTRNLSQGQKTSHALGKLLDKFRKIGRNEQCPCGSGKKYKKCCDK